MTAVDVQRYIS